jgi:formylglycine-generating enzyme
MSTLWEIRASVRIFSHSRQMISARCETDHTLWTPEPVAFEHAQRNLPNVGYKSGEQYNRVRDRPLAFDEVDMKAVRNIARLVRVYRVRPPAAARASTPAIPWRVRTGRTGAAVAGSIIGLAVLAVLLVLALPGLGQTITSNTLSAPTSEIPNGADEMSAWAKVKRSDQIDELASYLDRFPNSRYSEYVRYRLNALRRHPSITKFRDCAECPEMVVIPSGSFTMGASQSEVDRYAFPSGMALPLHPVTITRQFALGEFLLTRKQYATFIAETGHGEPGCFATPPDTPLLKFDAARNWREPGFTQADNHPVICVSWDDAIAYVNWLSKKTGQKYRLPTEAEWEYAGHAGDETARYFGDAPVCEFANVRDHSKRLHYFAGQFFNECNGGFSYTSPVGSFPPNGFGLYDMIGNAWEWVEDCWKFSYAGAPSDGTAREEEPCMARVRRGGSWNSTERYLYAVVTRAATNPEWHRETDGFRIARDYPMPANAPGH